MSDLPNPNQTVDLQTVAQLLALRRQFEAAWQEALQGGAQPQIETYLALVPEPERALLHTELSQIELTHLEGGSRASSRPAPNGAAEADVKTIPIEPINAGPPLSLESAETVELSRPSAEAASALTATVDPERGVAFDSRPGDFSVAPGALAPAAGSPPVVAGYEILEELGRGGMGVVYKARQVGLNRTVALKMVLDATYAGPHQLARFSTEAQAVAQLQHSNIVQIYEVGQNQGLPFFSLELLEGGSLTEKIDGKPQPPLDAAQTALSLALAMAVAHGRGIIHRDLKPGNVLLSQDGTPKITDFRLAKRLEDDSSHTRTGTLMGTPSYMSPEPARGDSHAIGPASDLSSLGAILYELLTSRPPFAGTTMLETLHMVRTADPVPPRRLQPSCPRDLETICLKCLQKEPHKRYPSCEALAQDLCRFLAGEPIHARPVGRLERLWRWCRRNPRVAVLSTAVGVLLLAVVVALAVVVVRVGREREAIAETRKAAGQRLEQATEAVAGGNYERAQVLLRWSDPLLSTHPGLGDLRAEMDTLRRQVDVYAEFKSLLDNARFACRFGSRREKEQGQRYCRQLLKLYDEIDQRQDRGEAGLPPLTAEQEQLFKEDVFEAFLVAAQVEQELASGAGPTARKKAVRQAIDWLNRAERVLPGTRTLYVQRAEAWGKLGNAAADKADMDRARTIEPTSAVDRFWRGYADHLRGDGALQNGDVKSAHEFYHKGIGHYAAFLQERPDHFWGYFNWAYCRFQLGDLHDALIGFTACIRLRPDFPWPYNNRGTAHHRLGQNRLAVADFTTALARNAQYAEAHANRGFAYVALKEEDNALEDFSQAIALNRDYVPAYTERAEIYRKRKQFAAAAADYTRLIELSTDRAVAVCQTLDFLHDYTRLIELSADRASLHVKRAEVFRAMNR